jgi:hypothetical protein
VNSDQASVLLQQLVERIPEAQQHPEERRLLRADSELVVEEIFGESSREREKLRQAWNHVALSSSLGRRQRKEHRELSTVRVALLAMLGVLARGERAVSQPVVEPPVIPREPQIGGTPSDPDPVTRLPNLVPGTMQLTLPEKITLDWLHKHVPIQFWRWGLSIVLTLLASAFMAGIRVGLTDFARELSGRDTSKTTTSEEQPQVEQARTSPQIVPPTPSLDSPNAVTGDAGEIASKPADAPALFVSTGVVSPVSCLVNDTHCWSDALEDATIDCQKQPVNGPMCKVMRCLRDHKNAASGINSERWWCTMGDTPEACNRKVARMRASVEATRDCAHEAGSRRKR